MESESELVARVVVEGDAKAFEALVVAHQGQIRGLLLRLTRGDASLADDLAQETFLSAYRGLRNFRADARFSTWLYRIAWNAWLQYLRRENRGCDTFEETEPVLLDRPVSAKIDLERAMEGLRLEERSAITLCYTLGLTHEEAAGVLDMPLGTVKSHVTRGREKLKLALAAWKDEMVS